jgi:RNA polymerase sigma factor (sigma-70 family)
MVKRIMLGKIANEEVARELVQETFLHAYLSLSHLRDDSRFKSWLYGIALNVCHSYLRVQKEPVLSLEDVMGGMYCDTSNVLDMMEDPQTLVEEHELQRFVFDAVQSLSSKDREVTLLFYYEEMSLQEISTTLHISVVAVKGRLHRARRQLRDLLSVLYTLDRRDALYTKKQRGNTMIQMYINSIRINELTDQRVVILQDEPGRKALVIWIGQAEAFVLAAGFTKTSLPRPMTAQLMVNLLQATGTQVEEVRIEALKDEIYYAIIKIHNGTTIQEVDARPSDALTLAVLMDAPIYATEQVLQQVGVSIPEDKAMQANDGEARKALVAIIQQQTKVALSFKNEPEKMSQLSAEHAKMIEFLTGEK